MEEKEEVFVFLCFPLSGRSQTRSCPMNPVEKKEAAAAREEKGPPPKPLGKTPRETLPPQRREKGFQGVSP